MRSQGAGYRTQDSGLGKILLVLKRGISYGNRSIEGVHAWDLRLGLMHTCRKLNVGYWDYLKDRFERRGQIPPLAKIIRAAA